MKYLSKNVNHLYFKIQFYWLTPCPMFLTLACPNCSWNKRGRCNPGHGWYIGPHGRVLFTFWKHSKEPEGEAYLVGSDTWWYFIRVYNWEAGSEHFSWGLFTILCLVSSVQGFGKYHLREVSIICSSLFLDKNFECLLLFYPHNLPCIT